MVHCNVSAFRRAVLLWGALAMLLCGMATGTALQFDAYRLVQYQITEDNSGYSDQYSAAMEHTVTHYGSQATSINSMDAVHFSSVLDKDESTSRKVCVIHYDDVVKLEKGGDELLRSLESKGTSGLLILLLDADRAHGGDKGSPEEQQVFQTFSDALTANLIGYPVYFSFESDDLLTWYNLLAKKDARTDDLTVQVKAHTGRTYLTDQMHLDVFYGVEQTSTPDGKPIIAVSASYDGFGASPALPSGSESSISPILAVMYMTRVFGRQFNQVKQRFDLMFILTPGASLNYDPTTKFIDYVQGSIKSKIQLVVCLDQLIDSSMGDNGDVPNLYVLDSKRSSTSTIRDAFIYSLKKEMAGSEKVGEVIERGVFEQPEDSKFVPYEHIAYASKGLPAITLTVREEPYSSVSAKFSVLDTNLCLCKLSKLLFVLNEAIAQTIVSPDLNVSGQFFGSEGIAKTDKAYLRQILNYLEASSRAPWFIERGSFLNKELFRLFDENLRQPARSIGIRVLDKVFVRDSTTPMSGSIHKKGSPIMDMAVFCLVSMYLYGVYSVVRHFATKRDPKVKPY